MSFSRGGPIEGEDTIPNEGRDTHYSSEGRRGVHMEHFNSSTEDTVFGLECDFSICCITVFRENGYLVITVTTRETT